MTMTVIEYQKIQRIPRKKYNTREGIQEYVDKFAGLAVKEVQELRAMRQELMQGKEHFDEFVIYGRFILTEKAELHVIHEEVPNLEELPEVMELDDFYELVKRNDLKTIRIF